MNSGAIWLSDFLVARIWIRTTNFNGQSQKDIGNLWSRFYTENIFETISNKLSPDIYCVYFDYENESKSFYTTIIGCKVSLLDDLPKTLISKNIPAGNYQKYISVGKLPESVVATWQEIWKSEPDRHYLADFDVYGEKSKDMNNAEVETYLSIK
jgi:predicted transcriptional regulator YdeE